MLPGFRFLFGAIVLCFSILIFGLGAAALLRAAHEEFASRPSWHGTASTMFAQQGDPSMQQNEAPRPVLALLEIEPPVKETGEQVPGEAAPSSEPSEPVATKSPAPDTVTVASLSFKESAAPDAAPTETAKPETPTLETAKTDTTEPGSAPEPSSITVAQSAPPRLRRSLQRRRSPLPRRPCPPR